MHTPHQGRHCTCRNFCALCTPSATQRLWAQWDVGFKKAPVQDRLDALENAIEALCDDIYIPHSRDCLRCPLGTLIVNLRQHAVEVHGSKDLKEAAQRDLHFCRSCDYVTEDNPTFESHGNVHKNRKPYFCPACHKRFTGRRELSAHVRRKHPGMPRPLAKEMRQMMDEYDAELRAKAARVSQMPSGSSAPTSNAPPQAPPPFYPPQTADCRHLPPENRQHRYAEQAPPAPPAYPSSSGTSASQPSYHDARAAWPDQRAPVHPPPPYAPQIYGDHVQATNAHPSHDVRQLGNASQAPPVYPSSRDASAHPAHSHTALRDCPPRPDYWAPLQPEWGMPAQLTSPHAAPGFGYHNDAQAMEAPPSHDAAPDNHAAWPEPGFAPPALDPAFHPVASAQGDPQRERFNYPRPPERRGRPAKKTRPSPVLSIASTSRRSSMAGTHSRHGSGSASPWQGSSGGWPSTPVSSGSSPYLSAPSPLQPSTPSSYPESGWPVATFARQDRTSSQGAGDTLSEEVTSEIVTQVSAQLLQHPDVLAELRRMTIAEAPASAPSGSAPAHSRSSSSGNASVTLSLAPLSSSPASPWYGSGYGAVDNSAPSSNSSPYAPVTLSRQASAQGSRPQSNGWLVDVAVQNDWASSDSPAALAYDEPAYGNLPPGFWNEDLEAGLRQMAVAEGFGTGSSQSAPVYSGGSFEKGGETGSSDGYAAQQNQAQSSTIPSEGLREQPEPSTPSAQPPMPESPQAIDPTARPHGRRAVFSATANNPFWHPWSEGDMPASSPNPALPATEPYTVSADFSTPLDMPEQDHFDNTNYFANDEVADMDNQIFPMDEEMMFPVRDGGFSEYPNNWDST
ncbi:uncharacterized protein SCHCODRAFT_02609225 [Schizophyllum commune H4-8]|uniref:uncharacterized protein n=1 Tax=Schizophyllum commune (strain H4-8 / FGSC 9210) TaxID=578458 RepID=UPI002160AA15|nr:uncharacterized protein SCHCODRAFT_02609225 [Schizophyllum commune H4-8]KAI5897384.1 hypothetical protein SCHCODRAFT_02609225 [Schizophyllum commune H4-8]